MEKLYCLFCLRSARSGVRLYPFFLPNICYMLLLQLFTILVAEDKHKQFRFFKTVPVKKIDIPQEQSGTKFTILSLNNGRYVNMISKSIAKGPKALIGLSFFVHSNCTICCQFTRNSEAHKRNSWHS